MPSGAHRCASGGLRAVALAERCQPALIVAAQGFVARGSALARPSCAARCFVRRNGSRRQQSALHPPADGPRRRPGDTVASSSPCSDKHAEKMDCAGIGARPQRLRRRRLEASLHSEGVAVRRSGFARADAAVWTARGQSLTGAIALVPGCPTPSRTRRAGLALGSPAPALPERRRSREAPRAQGHRSLTPKRGARSAAAAARTTTTATTQIQRLEPEDCCAAANGTAAGKSAPGSRPDESSR
jgi:hypothetical protein